MEKISQIHRQGALMIQIILTFLMVAENANAWILSEFYKLDTDDSGEYTVFWYQIENNSFDDIIGFAVGIGPSYSDTYETVISAPTGTDSPVGDWGYNTRIVDGEAWDFEVLNDADENQITIASFFGYTWDEFFGHYGYQYAYVALPDGLDEYLDGVFSYPDGWIPAGSTYGNGGDEFNPYTDFGFRYYAAAEPASPVIAKFGQGAVITGETGASNANPVPVPGAIWLLGSGLLGFVVARKGK